MTSGFAEVIGDPIAQSKSPAIHRHWLALAGLDFDYRATQVTRAELPDFVAGRRRDSNWRGCNVTMPLKLDAAILADDTTDRAVAAGAANILVAKDGALLAGNTDVGGVLQLLGPRLGQGAAGGITLLGNGGAARAVLVALRMLGIGDVRLQARDVADATRLAVQFGLSERPRPFDAAIDTAGLINATPMGMAGEPPFAIDLSGMPPAGWVFDLVTDPVETALLRAARERGLATIDGISMLVEQAAASFMLLFGQEPPRQDDAELMETLRV
jgi:shikimate dehydrogenase